MNFIILLDRGLGALPPPHHLPKKVPGAACQL